MHREMINAGICIHQKVTIVKKYPPFSPISKIFISPPLLSYFAPNKRHSKEIALLGA
jgi:hypothetical protein